MSASRRGKMLYELGRLVERNAAHLAAIESRDNGKLISEVSGQVHYVAEYFYYHAGLADKIHGLVVPIDKAGKMITFQGSKPVIVTTHP